MEKIVEQTLLYDFYGDLLTDRQKEVYEEIVFNDLSLSEAAEEYGISRQGIHDMIRRSENALREYEEKLHMIRRFQTIRELTEEALEQLEVLQKAEEAGGPEKIHEAVAALKDQLTKIQSNLL
ncbi:MAG: DNA-binding protein [Lachnospiraceae bacterium]|nr:DNA-binding protein [Lachnospiraceae bacterium]